MQNLTRMILSLLTFLAAFSSCEKVQGSDPSVIPGTVPYVSTTTTSTVSTATTTADETQTTTSTVTTETTSETSDTESTTSATTTTTEAAPVLPDDLVRFDKYSDYSAWAQNTGYPQGLLDSEGMSGLNQDHFHTPAGSEGYLSGRIVIGDSRCCQLGIFQARTGRSDFAAFAVWGGHYASGMSGAIMSEAHFAEVESCFREQVRACGSSVIYLFATVNDYDCYSNSNASYISAAVNTAHRLAEMSCDVDGKTCHPEVIVVGFDGCWTTSDLYGTPQEVFNQYVDDYNSRLLQAVSADSLLSSNAGRFTTVPAIAGGKAGFIDDGLHYSDDTLADITSFVIGN